MANDETGSPLNAGLRWEPYFGPSILNGAVYNFSLDNFRKGIKSTVFRQCAGRSHLPRRSRVPAGETGLNTQWWNLSPRVGVAWDVSGRRPHGGALVLRHRRMTSRPRSINSSTPIRHRLATGRWWKILQACSTTRTDTSEAIRIRSSTNADTQFIPFGAFGATDPDINSPRIQSWNVTFERQIGSVLAGGGELSGQLHRPLVGPGGDQSRRLPGARSLHAQRGVLRHVHAPTRILNQRRLFSLSGENPAAAQLIGNMDMHTDAGTQDYRGLKLSFQRRAASGVSLIGNYTWSRCFGNADHSGGGFPQLGKRLHEPSRPGVRSRPLRSGPDPHRAASRWGRKRRSSAAAALHALASGWRVSGILSYPVRAAGSTSRPAGTTRSPASQQQRVNQVLDDVYGDEDLDALPEPGRFRAAGPGHAGQLSTQQHSRARILDGRSGAVEDSFPLATRSASSSEWRRSICSTPSTGAIR